LFPERMALARAALTRWNSELFRERHGGTIGADARNPQAGFAA